MLILKFEDRILVLGDDVSSSGGYEASGGGGGGVAPSFSINPAVSGTAQVGVALSSTNGTFSGTPTPTVTSRIWQYSDSGVGAPTGTISGATSSTYSPTETYEGKYVRIGVTVSNTEGSQQAFSDWYGPVIPSSEFVPSYEAFAALSSNGARSAYIAQVEAWFGANTGVRAGPALTTSSATTPSGTHNRVRFTAGKVYPADNTVFNDCQFDGAVEAHDMNITYFHCDFAGTGAFDYRLASRGTVEYCKVRSGYDGMKPNGNNTIIRWCYFYNPYREGVDPHNDGVQVTGGVNGVLVENCLIKWADTSELFMHEGPVEWGKPSNATFRRNWLNGSDLNIRINNCLGTNQCYENVIQPGVWGWRDFTGSTVTQYGNLNMTTGATLT